MTGQSVGSDASRLSCFLFRPRKRLEKRKKRSHTNVSNTLVARPSTPPAETPQRSFQGAAAGTDATPAPNRAHSGLHGETRGVSDGAAITTLGAFRTFTNIPGSGIRTANFAAFGSWSEALLKDTESLRNSDALMRVAVPRRRGPAGLRDLFTFVEVAACTPCAQGLSACAKEGWYHYPRCAPRAAETPDGRLSKRLICSFLVSPIYICERPRRALPISALIQIDCRWISCGQTACPWLIQA